jgi:hypothetical protein
MHTVGPYRLLSALSSCEVGGAWSAVDEAGRAVTIAMLNTRASDDQRWRDAFAAAAQALADAEGDQLPIVAADHTAASPWVACAVERGPGAAQIFVALGQRLQSAAAPAPAEAPARQQAERGRASAPHVPHQPGPPDRNDPRQTGDRAGPVRSPAATAGPWDRPPAAAAAATASATTSTIPVTPVTPVASVAPPRQVRDGTGPGGDANGPVPAPWRPDPPGWSTPGTPTSGAPVSGAPSSGGPSFGLPVSGVPSPGDPLSAYPPRYFAKPDPAPARRRRTGLLLAAVAIAALAVGAGAGGAVMAGRSSDDPAPTPTAASDAAVDLALPSTPPIQPGAQPPVGGGWPADFATFRSDEPAVSMNKLDGLGFSFKIPQGWNCTQDRRTSGYVKYRCGIRSGDEMQIGGDVVVRTCVKPCTEERRTQLRQAEEAWGLRWIRSGPFATWAQTQTVDGAQRYGLVYIAYWRSNREDALDRQLVFRMTAPPGSADQVRKTANSIREETFTF